MYKYLHVALGSHFNWYGKAQLQCTCSYNLIQRCILQKCVRSPSNWRGVGNITSLVARELFFPVAILQSSLAWTTSAVYSPISVSTTGKFWPWLCKFTMHAALCSPQPCGMEKWTCHTAEWRKHMRCLYTQTHASWYPQAHVYVQVHVHVLCAGRCQSVNLLVYMPPVQSRVAAGFSHSSLKIFLSLFIMYNVACMLCSAAL